MRTSRLTTLLPVLGLLLLSINTPVMATEPGSVTGNVYCDLNKDGVCDCEEAGLKDIHIQIFAGRCGGTALQTVSTDEKGNFAFRSFEPGTYFIKVDLDYVCGGRVPTTTSCRQVKLVAGETINLPAFGYSDYGQ